MTEPQFDGYQVVSKLGSGPATDTYHALQQPLGRPVLIKSLSASILPSSPFAATLEREARLLSELDHPSIPKVYDFVRRTDRMWLVLEHVEGWTLEELLERFERLSPLFASAVGAEVARALSHAHDRGVIHRDIRPRNVLVTRRGAVKLQNFSIAVDERLPTAPELLDGGHFGGPFYMSPEQILGERADPRSDLFSLGVVLYELVAGKRPFDAPDDRSATQRIRHDPAPPLGRQAPQVPGSLERAVHHCLEKLPSDRYGSATELSAALEQVARELGASSPAAGIERELVRLGLIKEERASPPGGLGQRPQARGPCVTTLVAGLVGCSLLIAAGGAVIVVGGERRQQRAGATASGTALELTPKDPGFLRVVAEPWAHVSVDGEQVDTTPFARSIPLPPGVHYVRLEHPNAPVERRTVRLVSGQTVLLDVSMKVAPPREPRPDAGPPDLGLGVPPAHGADAAPSP